MTSTVSFSQKHLFILLLRDVEIVYLHLRFCHSLLMYFLTNCPFQLSQICLYVKNLSKQDWAAKCFEVSVCHQGGEVGACPKNKSCHLCHNCHNNENLDIRCAISKLDDRPVGAHINYLSISIGLNQTDK